MGGFLLGLISIVFFISMTMGAIYLLYQLMVNFQPGNNKIQSDVKKIRENIAPFISELAPWTQEEFELLSLNQTHRKVRKKITKTIRGVITNIYHEPLIAYSFKKYFGTNTNGLLVARTADKEFIYRIKNNDVQIWINGEELGKLSKRGQLFAGRRKKLLAQISREDELALPILVKNREVASLTNPAHARKTNPRAFELIRPDIEPQEEQIVLALSILEIISRTNKLS